MNWFSKLLALFSNDRGFMVRDGHELHWAHPPITVVMTPEAWTAAYEHVTGAVRALNEGCGKRVFMLPMTATSEMISSFARLQNMTWDTAMVDMCDPADTMHGHTEHSYDRKTGEIRSALITLPRGMDSAMAASVALHEMGHALGLDHDQTPRSIMFPVTTGRGQVLLASDQQRLRRVYA